MTTILVTGANRGIGLEFVRQYTAEGAHVLATCRKPAEARQLAALKGNINNLELDVTDGASIARLKQSLHGQAIDILINNAGIYGPDRQSASDADAEGFAETFRVNSIAPLMVSQALHDNLKRGKDKKIVVMTSKMGSISDSSGGVLAYRASKAASNMIMHGAARAWARDGIVVGILHPGWVKTDMGGPGALITPEESVREMRARIAELGPETSGRFLDYRGRDVGW